MDECEHEWRLNSEIKFTDKRYFLCFEVPVEDFEICIKCGTVKNIVYGGESRCC